MVKYYCDRCKKQIKTTYRHVWVNRGPFVKGPALLCLKCNDEYNRTVALADEVHDAILDKFLEGWCNENDEKTL